MKKEILDHPHTTVYIVKYLLDDGDIFVDELGFKTLEEAHTWLTGELFTRIEDEIIVEYVNEAGTLAYVEPVKIY